MSTVTPPCVLTIAGSDSCAGAGIQADLKTFAAHGVYGLCALTAVTAQTGNDVTRIQPVDPETISAQVRALSRTYRVAALKTGMLANEANVRAVASAIRQHRPAYVVVDPVTVSSSGHALLERDAIKSLLHDIFPLADMVTPNRAELTALAGVDKGDITSLKRAAETLMEYGAKWVLVTGGDAQGSEAVDELFGPSERHTFRAPRVPGPAAHGTGCTLSAAIVAQLALGKSMPEAVELAKGYVSKTLVSSFNFGGNIRLLNHSAPHRPSE